MPSITVRNVSDEVHRAIRIRAAQNGRSIEAEMREILESAVKHERRVKLGSLLAQTCRKVKLTDEELATFEKARDKVPARAVNFEQSCSKQM